ncbi:hypothetical protein BB561_000771 [Smittium simulii]|uniref:Uncharacterized protein n=1 Tax=Smittium simulii TaxID=133385 RepID=A0A2T9YXL3_9FUNG|nr:hypothetical protein BB561_000771 [Smittium simulii]
MLNSIKTPRNVRSIDSSRNKNGYNPFSYPVQPWMQLFMLLEQRGKFFYK